MKANSPVRVLICTGHTGGHFFPAVSCAEAFQAQYPEAELHFLLSRMPVFCQEAVQEGKFRFHLIPFSSPPSFFSFKMILFLLECTNTFWKTLFFIFKLKPRLVIGFGSYSSVFGVMCALGFGIPTLLHEQNASFGKANRFLAPWARRIAVSFPETEGKVPSRKIFWSGFPLRHEFFDRVNHRSFEPFSQKRFTILVFGGSQGAKRLNQVFLESLEAFSVEEKADFAVIHIVGNNPVEEIKKTYQKLEVASYILDFSSDISEYYHSADLVISRAGAGTIFELAAVGRPSILIPYPHAYGHQKLNAEHLTLRKAAVAIPEEDLTPQILVETIRTLRRNAQQRNDLVRNIKTLSKPEAAQTLAQTGWELVCAKN